MSFVPMTLSATAGVPPHEAGLASGLINTTRQVGGALGLATVATTVATSHRGHHNLVAALTAGYWAGLRGRRWRTRRRRPVGLSASR
jgi:hypothetical protein